MINNEILSFIKEQVAQGTTKDQVKEMLVGQGGWDEKDVEEAFETINFSSTAYPTVLKNAETQVLKNKEAEATTPAEKFPLMPELTKSVSPAPAQSPSPSPAPVVASKVTTFAPGFSHGEQPKSMEPSVPSPSLSSSLSSMMSRPVGAANVSVAPVHNESNALADLRSKMAAGSPAVGGETAPMQAIPAVFPKIKEPMVVAPISKPVTPLVGAASPELAPKASMSSPVVSSNNVSPWPQTSAVGAPSAGQGSSFSPLPSLSKTSMSFSPATSSPLPTAVFPKGQSPMMNMPGNNSRLSPTPAQINAIKKQRSGRFLLGLMMFFIGIAFGGISMNAYMNGYVNMEKINVIIEKGMDMIGLGTVTAPSEQVPASESAPENPTTTTP
jgi:hypothetical protein